MASVALSIISPILSVIGKLMRFTSKLQINNETLEALLEILDELKI
jgi:hypothetical protein